jgi:hypothetical protein
MYLKPLTQEKPMTEMYGEQTETDIFEFLTELRDGGSINMMGAPRELQREFGLSKGNARKAFFAWTESLSHD